MPSIELTKEERDNLIVFLQRTRLTGNEVPAYVKILNALNKEFLEDLSKNK